MADPRGLLILVSATFLASCAAASDADPGLYDEPVSSAQESLTRPGLVVVSREYENEDFAVLDACPSNLPYVLGAGFYAVGSSANDLYSQFDGVEAWDSKVAGKATSNASFLEIFATCSNARGTKRFSDIGNGDATANCQSGEVAVGGGAICNDSGAHLYRSRPNPDTDESEPTGWRASCTKGTMKTYVTCRDKDATYDFTDCKTERVDTAASLARVVCDTGYDAISGGGYCSNQDALRGWWVYSDLSGSGTSCRNADMIHGYAICCRRRLDDPE